MCVYILEKDMYVSFDFVLDTADIWLLKEVTFVGLVTYGVNGFEIKIYIQYN